jgi:glycosyltransferase involved in cell wall biosynthesis
VLAFSTALVSKMNILCLGPVMCKTLCDDYFVYKRLKEKGAKVAFITGKTSGARANGIKLPLYESDDGIPIHRVYNNPYEMAILPRRRLKNVLEIAKELDPDIIHCQGADIGRLGFSVGKHLRIPVVVHVEIASGIVSEKFVGSRKMRAIRLLAGMPIRGPLLWSWLCKKADALITSHPPDQQILDFLSEHGKPVYYLPWPANIPEECKLHSKRNRQRGIYAGLLVPFKNTQAFEWVLPLIFQKTHTKEFVIIGTGADSAIIQKLKQQFGDAIKYIPSLPRCEVIRMVSGSYYAFSPVRKGGWGFIGDCWATETPLLMLNNVFVSKELDSCVARNGEDLVQKINRLYEDPLFYSQLQKVGYDAYSKRTADVVGDELYKILSRTIENTRA